MAFSPVYRGDAYATLKALKPGMIGVVAEAPGHDGLAGMGLLEFGRCRVDGGDVPYALLSSLMVDPAFRRRGIATRLAHWRIELAEERFGPDGLILANVQNGNAGSRRVAERWSTQVLPPFAAVAVPFRRRPPPVPDGVVIRMAERAELDRFAHYLDGFYADHALHRPETSDELAAWLGGSNAVSPSTEAPFAVAVDAMASPAVDGSPDAPTEIERRPVRHLLVALDRSGAMLAGLCVDEVHHLMTLRLAGLPFVPSAVRCLPRHLPGGGELRLIRVERLWFAPGRLDAARALFETVRHRWRGTATAMLVVTDERSPVAAAYGIRRWWPKGRAETFVRSRRVVPEGHPIRPIV